MSNKQKHLEKFIGLCEKHGVNGSPEAIEALFLEFTDFLKKPTVKVNEVIAAYYDEMLAVRKIKPAIPGDAANRLKASIKSMTTERACDLIRTFVHMPDEWFALKVWDLDTFRTNLNKVIMFHENKILLSRKQIQAALPDPEKDDDADAVRIADLIIERVSRDGANNHERARARIGEIGWAAIGGARGWGDFCRSLNSNNVGTIRAQLRQSVKAQMRRPLPRDVGELNQPASVSLESIMTKALSHMEMPK